MVFDFSNVVHIWSMLYYADLDNTICTPTNLEEQLLLWTENIGLYYVSGCEIQNHSIARLEIFPAVLPKVQVFWNVRTYPPISSSRSLQGLHYYYFRDEVIILFQGQFRTEEEDAAVVRNVGNYIITMKLKIRQTLLFIKQTTSLSYVATPCFGLDFIKPLLACSNFYIKMKIM
jgi:hypothetical protein